MIIDNTEKPPVNNTGYSDFVFNVFTNNPAAFVHHIAGVKVNKLKYLSNGDMLNIITEYEKSMTEDEKESFITWYC